MARSETDETEGLGGLTMGVDLVLMPALSKDCDAAQDVLNCERRCKLFDDILELPSKEIESVRCFLGRTESGEEGYGPAYFDSYSEPLRVVTVDKLLELSSHEGVRDNFHNRGIWRLLAEYPADWPVVLFWT